MTEHPSNSHDIFRKVWDPSCLSDLNEYDICRLIKDNPHKNLVHIYDVQRSHVDEEMLDVNLNCSATEFLEYGGLEQIRMALDHLHKLGVLYIDLKLENIGWSTIDSCYKLFDFNASCIIDLEDGKIRRPPMNGFILRKIEQKMCMDKNKDPFRADFYAFDMLTKDVEKEALDDN